MTNFHFFVLAILVSIAAPLFAQDQLTSAQSLLVESASEHQLSATDVGEYGLTDHHISKKSKVAHFYFQQQYRNIFIEGATASVHLLEDGSLLSLNNKFESKLAYRITDQLPLLTAQDAIIRVASNYGYPNNGQLEIIEPLTGITQAGIFRNTAISLRDIPVRLMYQPIDGGAIRLAWDFSILETTQENWWSIRVDAITGEILNRDNWMVTCNFESTSTATCSEGHHHHHAKEAPTKTTNAGSDAALVGSYNVYAYPVESPNHGGRTVVNDPEDLNASPFGWHDINGASGSEFTITRGNNVHAYEDGDNVGFSPDGGGALNFNFPVNTTYSAANQSESASITNLFYWNNIFHDIWYQYGFDEASGNFQENNYGNGGLGSDYVQAEGQDGSGTCNANFGTPPDGNNPTMQMYICDTRDADYDNGVIAHEYGHGFSTRLTGGASNSGCLGNAEQMGEGWSDYFGMVMTIEAGDQGTDSRGMGTWLNGEGANGNGIRPQPYSTNMAINSQTYNNIQTAAIPHGVGSVWCTMLWEMTWALIDVYGFDPDFYYGNGGNNIAMALVTEGMKLQPCSPGFVDGRDAILAADQALYNGANQCLIWEAFAKRGLGRNANQGSSGSVSDGTESFDVPALEIEKTADVVTGTHGTTVTYTLTVANLSPCGLTYTNILITDDLPQHTTYVNGSASNGGSEAGGTISFPLVGVLAPGNTITRSFSVTIDNTAPINIFSIADDMEGGTANWVINNNGSTAWNLTTASSNSPSNSWFANDGDSPGIAALQLVSPIVPDGDSQLSFWHHYNTEATWDGGLVQYSDDGGQSWSDMGDDFIQNGYNSTINNSAATPAFSGDSGGYIESIINLENYSGQTILIRFLMYCDALVGGEGWYIDDVTLNRSFNSIPNTAMLTAAGGISATGTLIPPTVLIPPHCLDGTQNMGETDVDCGGPCLACLPNCFDGVQNGDETGVDCGGSCTDCLCLQNGLVLNIVLDNYPNETTWEIRNASNVVVEAGGNYEGEASGTLIERFICLPDGCYDFIIYDSYGDGICCGYGNGSYELTLDGSGNSAVVASGGAFGSVETTNFCVQRPACVNDLYVPGPVATALYNAEISVTSDGTVEDGSNVIFQAGTCINLDPGFEVAPNSDFLAEIVPCSANPTTLTASNPTSFSTSIRKLIAFNINPLTQKANIQYKLKDSATTNMYIRDINGSRLAQISTAKFQNEGKYQLEWDSSALKSGIYFLVLELEDGTEVVEKIVID